MRFNAVIAICLTVVLCLVQFTAAAAPSITFSPFTKNSDFIEVTIENPPAAEADGLEYEFSITTVGFTAKKTVEIEIDHKYRSTPESPWKSESSLRLVNFNGKDKEITTDLEFKAKFLKIKTADQAGGHQRFVRFRFDIVNWTTPDGPEVSFTAKMRSTKTKTEFDIPMKQVVPFAPLSETFKLSMSKKGKDKHQQSFKIEFGKTQAPISTASGKLILYSFVEKYHFEPVNATVVDSTCKLGAYTVPATFFNEDETVQQYISLDLALGENIIPTGSTIELTCPDFVVYRNDTTLHLTEYWVAYTSVDNLHSTHYVGGMNRLDHIVKYGIFIVAILAILILLTLVFCTWVVCKRCQCCCYKPKRDPREVNMPVTDYYSRM